MTNYVTFRIVHKHFGADVVNIPEWAKICEYLLILFFLVQIDQQRNTLIRNTQIAVIWSFFAFILNGI